MSSIFISCDSWRACSRPESTITQLGKMSAGFERTKAYWDRTACLGINKRWPMSCHLFSFQISTKKGSLFSTKKRYSSSSSLVIPRYRVRCLLGRVQFINSLMTEQSDSRKANSQTDCASQLCGGWSCAGSLLWWRGIEEALITV